MIFTLLDEEGSIFVKPVTSTSRIFSFFEVGSDSVSNVLKYLVKAVTTYQIGHGEVMASESLSVYVGLRADEAMEGHVGPCAFPIKATKRFAEVPKSIGVSICDKHDITLCGVIV
jgi:hypothetical protein